MNRAQKTFDALNVQPCVDCAQSFESLRTTLSSISSGCSSLDSISGMLSNKMSEFLSLSADSVETSAAACDLQGKGNSMSPSTIDIEWLRSRCDGDHQLLRDVLHTFRETGEAHIGSLWALIKKPVLDQAQISFHAVH
jgi:hypothetical protein